MRAPEADRAISFVANGEDETVRNAIDDSVRAISGFAVVEPVVSDDRENLEIDPARERDTVLRKIDGLLGRIEISLLSYIQFVRVAVKPDRGASRGAMRSSPQDSVRSSRYKRRRNNQGGYP
jgi:hypothetical protein